MFNYFDFNFTIFILYGVENQGIPLLAKEENQRHGEEESKLVNFVHPCVNINGNM